MINGFYDPIGVLLQQEGSLIRACLLAGLRELKRAGVGDSKGQFYSAFFLLSIGLERLMKVILIIDHMARNELQVPDEGEIKAYGHDLIKLRKSCQELTTKYSLEIDELLSPDNINDSIWEFLHVFARKARYHNLDTLSSGPSSRSQDPLERWHQIVMRIFEADATNREKGRVASDAQVRPFLFEPIAVVIVSGLNQQPESATSLLFKQNVVSVASKYSVKRTLTIIRSLGDLLEAATANAHSIQNATANELVTVPWTSDFLDFAYYGNFKNLGRW